MVLEFIRIETDRHTYGWSASKNNANLEQSGSTCRPSGPDPGMRESPDRRANYEEVTIKTEKVPFPRKQRGGIPR